MNMTCPETTPVVGVIPHVMEPLHAEFEITYLGAVVVPGLPAVLSGRPFKTLVKECVHGDRLPDSDGTCRAATLLERNLQAAN